MRPEFVDAIPETIAPGILYVCIRYGTAVHQCPCGCGREVVTPISPTGWRLLYDGERISLYPSIGNWQFPCESHYWISDNQVQWAESWSKARVSMARERDRKHTQQWYGQRQNPKQVPSSGSSPAAESQLNFDLWMKFKRLRDDDEADPDQKPTKPKPEV